MNASPSYALEATRLWVERVVIGLNLCPFAKAVEKKGQIRYVESLAQTGEALLSELEQELRALAAADPELVDTTLLVHPAVFGDFLDHNDFLGDAEARLAQLGLEGVLQLASFHPDYCFAGADLNDAANATNRSPYPTLHLLREASVSRAVAAFPDASSIYERNIALLRGLEPVALQRLLKPEKY